MIYRIDLVAFLRNKKDAEVITATLQHSLPMFSLVKATEEGIEASSITLQECYHDETPPKPCVILKHYDNMPKPFSPLVIIESEPA